MLSWKRDEWHAFAVGCAYVLASFVFFRILQFIVRWYLFGKCTFRTFSYFGLRARLTRNGASTRRNTDSTTLTAVPPNKKWRICNEAVSFIHSVVSGLWAAYSILVYQDILKDMVFYRHPLIVNLIFVSTGYLLNDLLDLLINERSIRILELLFHHIVVLMAFATTQITEKFLGVVIFGLLMEINSIFLHTRSLLNLFASNSYGKNKKSVAFRMIALLNMITLVSFRMAVSFYLSYWQATVAWSMDFKYALVTFFVITSLLCTNLVLAYRVMAADGLLGASRARPRKNLPAQAEEGEITEKEVEAEKDNGEEDEEEEDEDEEDEEEDCKQPVVTVSEKVEISPKAALSGKADPAQQTLINGNTKHA